MADLDFDAAKKALRVRAKAQRAALDAPARRQASETIASHFFAQLRPGAGEAVAVYWHLPDEVDCEPIIVGLFAFGVPVCLPAVLAKDLPLEWRLWSEGEGLYPAGFGTLAPSELAPKVQPDVILVPLLAFDRRGTRLGYGGGFYDRSIAAMARRPRLIGLAFASQELEDIPRAEHDVALDAVVTEQGVHDFTGTLR